MTLYYRHLQTQKIQGTYFKICALYFEINALCFSQSALCFSSDAYMHFFNKRKPCLKMRFGTKRLYVDELLAKIAKKQIKQYE